MGITITMPMRIVVTELPVHAAFCLFNKYDPRNDGYFCIFTDCSYRCDDTAMCPYLKAL